MPRRSKAFMAKAVPKIHQLAAAGLGDAEIARRVGVNPATVYRYRHEAQKSPCITNTADVPDGGLPAPRAITWREVLDGLQAGGKPRRAELLRVTAEWANSFDDLDAPARVAVRMSCGCLADDIKRSPCPGHDVVAPHRRMATYFGSAA